jgi:hypothetical protein
MNKTRRGAEWTFRGKEYRANGGNFAALSYRPLSAASSLA